MSKWDVGVAYLKGYNKLGAPFYRLDPPIVIDDLVGDGEISVPFVVEGDYDTYRVCGANGVEFEPDGVQRCILKPKDLFGYEVCSKLYEYRICRQTWGSNTYVSPQPARGEDGRWLRPGELIHYHDEWEGIVTWDDDGTYRSFLCEPDEFQELLEKEVVARVEHGPFRQWWEGQRPERCGGDSYSARMESAFQQTWKKHGYLSKLINDAENVPLLKGGLLDRDYYVAATIIQWLGTNVGRCFVDEARELGEKEYGKDYLFGAKSKTLGLRRQHPLREDAERKAAKCIQVATAMLGQRREGAPLTEELEHVAAIENQALDLMDLSDEQLQSTLERLGEVNVDSLEPQDVPVGFEDPRRRTPGLLSDTLVVGPGGTVCACCGDKVFHDGANVSLRLTDSQGGTVFEGCLRCFDAETKDNPIARALLMSFPMAPKFR